MFAPSPIFNTSACYSYFNPSCHLFERGTVISVAYICILTGRVLLIHKCEYESFKTKKKSMTTKNGLHKPFLKKKNIKP